MYAQSNQAIDPMWLQQQPYTGAAGMSSSYAQAGLVDTPKRVPELPAVLQTLSERSDVLEKCIAELENRLRAIMRDVPPNANGLACPPYPSATPVTSTIAQTSTRIDAMIGRVRMLLDLLEL